MKKENLMDFQLIYFMIGDSNFTVPPGRVTKATKGGYKLKSHILPSLDENLLIVKILVELEITFKKKNVRLGMIETASFFNIKNISKYFKKEVPSFPVGFIEMLLSIAISSSRGAFSARSIHLDLPSSLVTMPLFNPTELVPDKWKNLDEK